MLKWLLVTPLLFYSLLCRGMIIEGAFSEWYWGSKGPMVDFNFAGMTFDGTESVFSNGKVECNGFYKCYFVVRAMSVGGFYNSFYGRVLNGDNNQHQSYSIEQFNQVVKGGLPFSGSAYFNGNAPKCVELYLFTGWTEAKLGSTCEGTLMPITPPPSVPVVCSVSRLSSDSIDFGMLRQGEAAISSLTASLFCDGEKNANGKALLRFTDISRSGKNYATLRDGQSGEEIKARLSVGSETGSNEKIMDVKKGYATDIPLFVQLEAGETNDKSGSFSGSAILLFYVL
ncbi:hypothetical protein [Serratia marcescens]|uniref:hypothetical protein n=1 Tax=Serratia marcescens TaxID=615 RepID=UPI0034D70133